MIRYDRREFQTAKGVPRPRGDDPGVKPAQRASLNSVPRTRGDPETYAI